MADDVAIYPIECEGYEFADRRVKARNHTEIRLCTKAELKKMTMCEACELELEIVQNIGDRCLRSNGIDHIDKIRAIATEALEHPELFSLDEINFLKQFAYEKGELKQDSNSDAGSQLRHAAPIVESQ